mgnify:CR=1 FL=1
MSRTRTIAGRAVRSTIEQATRRQVRALTLFAFSSENWRRPPEEVSFLMQLFLRSLEQERRKIEEGMRSVEARIEGDMDPYQAAARMDTDEVVALGAAVLLRGVWEIVTIKLHLHLPEALRGTSGRIKSSI